MVIGVLVATSAEEGAAFPTNPDTTDVPAETSKSPDIDCSLVRHCDTEQMPVCAGLLDDPTTHKTYDNMCLMETAICTQGLKDHKKISEGACIPA